MRHVKGVTIGKDANGNPINQIVTDQGYVISTYSIDYPKTDDYIQIVDMILSALENATITLDPKTNTITISFQKQT